MAQYKTSTHFFPSNRHRLRTSAIQSPLLSLQRREIKEHLSSIVANQNHRTLPHPISKSLPHKSNSTPHNHSHDRKSKAQSHTTLCQTKKMRIDNVGIFNLLQKVRCLKSEETMLTTNPFYKIQKSRKRNGQLREHQFRSQTLPEDKLNFQQAEKTQQHQSKLFHNQSLWGLSLQDKTPKIRTKSETVTYYEIKNYFEQKYGKHSSVVL